jgi:hypothetical protein
VTDPEKSFDDFLKRHQAQKRTETEDTEAAKKSTLENQRRSSDFFRREVLPMFDDLRKYLGERGTTLEFTAATKSRYTVIARGYGTSLTYIVKVSAHPDGVTLGYSTSGGLKESGDIRGKNNSNDLADISPDTVKAHFLQRWQEAIRRSGK